MKSLTESKLVKHVGDARVNLVLIVCMLFIGVSFSTSINAQQKGDIGLSARQGPNQPAISVMPDANAVKQLQEAGNSTKIRSAYEPVGNPKPEDKKSGVPEIPRRDVAERNEFQNYVLNATGQNLPIFGGTLFQGAPTTFAPLDHVPVTADYVLGPGDEIVINGWGQIDVAFRGIIDRNGAISIPKIGAIHLAGIQYKDLHRTLTAAFSRIFRNFELTATLGSLRTIQILVVGEAMRPGSYSVGSMSTLINAIFAAGGPSSKGSLRKITLRRSNKEVAAIDLYDLLVFGDKANDLALLPGDVIVFHAAGPQVALLGSVNRPAIYELNGHADINQLIKYASGFSPARGAKGSIESIRENTDRNVRLFDIAERGEGAILRNGDIVTVFGISPRFNAIVTIKGSVAAPGRFPWREGMRISDLLPSKEALLSVDYWLKRNQLDGPQAGVADFVKMQSAESAVESIPAAVKDRGSLAGIRVNERDVNWEYAVVERIVKRDLSTSLIPFNLHKAVVDREVQHDLVLERDDIITVFTKNEIGVPVAQQTRYVRLEGEFVASGVYQIAPGETLRQLVLRVGGVTPNAYLYGANLFRESVRVRQQKTLETLVQRFEKDLQNVGLSRASSAVSAEDSALLRNEAFAQQQILAQLKQVRPTGRLVIGLSERATVKDIPDVVLENGDHLSVPSRPSTITVLGEVNAENAFVHVEHASVSDYIRLAGGVSRNADRSGTYIVRANGAVSAVNNSGVFPSDFGQRPSPGDSIVVPPLLEKPNLTRTLRDISQIFFQFGLGAAAIKVLKQ